MTGIVVVVYWLISGQPAFDYMQADQCAALAVMTKNSGGVFLELANGATLHATSIDCLPLQEAQLTQ